MSIEEPEGPLYTAGAAASVRHVVAWLAPVRWVTCVLLWVAVAVGWMFPGADLPVRTIAASGLTAAMCRTAVALWSRRDRPVPRSLAAVSLSADALFLTGLLDITGGPFNPFLVMYVTYVWIAAVTTSPRWTALVAIVSAGGFGWLVLDHVQAELTTHHRLNDFPNHLFTMWVSAAAVAELVAHYVSRGAAALALRQRQLEETRERALRSEHFASLTALAAGAAHELSTPLATIAVAARELERNADQLSTRVPAVTSLREDAKLIRAEVDRCQVILDDMSGRAQDGARAAAEPLAAAALAQIIRGRLTDAQQRQLRVEIATGVPVPSVSGVAMVQAISSMLRNAFDAGEPSAEVVLRFTQRGPMVRVEVHDRGPGMPPAVQRRACEPFFTTKEPGRGIGLGLFLTRTFAERSGGTLRFDTGNGTTAVLEVPARQTDVEPA